MAKLSIHSGYLPGKRPPPRARHSSSLHRLPRFTHRKASRAIEKQRERETRRRKEKERERERGGAEEEKTKDWRHTRILLRRAIFVLVRYFTRRSRLLSTIPVNHPDRLDRHRQAAAATAARDADSETIVPAY